MLAINSLAKYGYKYQLIRFLPDLPIKTTFPTMPFHITYSILLSTPTRAALCLTERVIGGRVTGVGRGL